MLLPVRRKCGIGLDDYDQNCNESMNSMIKKAKEKSKLTIKETISLIKSEVKLQEDRLKSALIGRGDWKLAPGFERFEVKEDAFYKMKPEQRKK